MCGVVLFFVPRTGSLSLRVFCFPVVAGVALPLSEVLMLAVTLRVPVMLGVLVAVAVPDSELVPVRDALLV